MGKTNGFDITESCSCAWMHDLPQSHWISFLASFRTELPHLSWCLQFHTGDVCCTSNVKLAVRMSCCGEQLCVCMCVCMFVLLLIEHTTGLQVICYCKDTFTKLLSSSVSTRFGVSSLLYFPCVLTFVILFLVWSFLWRNFLTLLFTHIKKLHSVA
jgi:hypothetical protein